MTINHNVLLYLGIDSEKAHFSWCEHDCRRSAGWKVAKLGTCRTLSHPYCHILWTRGPQIWVFIPNQDCFTASIIGAGDTIKSNRRVMCRVAAGVMRYYRKIPVERQYGQFSKPGLPLAFAYSMNSNGRYARSAHLEPTYCSASRVIWAGSRDQLHVDRMVYTAKEMKIYRIMNYLQNQDLIMCDCPASSNVKQTSYLHIKCR